MAKLEDMDWEKIKLAKEYLETHKIEQLFLNLCALLVYRQPRDPYGYITRQISKMTKHTLFSQNDLELMYGILDTSKTGCLSKDKCAIALQTLGLGESQLRTTSNCVPKESFVVDCQIALQETWDLLKRSRKSSFPGKSSK